MEASSPVLQRDFIEFPVESLRSDSRIDDPPPNVADIARSERNILQWMSYLPEECIRTMIQMGWDVTT
jgi:hypothetical protein